MHANVCIKTFWTFDPEGHRDMTFISYMSLTVPSVSIEINARASIGSVYNTCALRILFQLYTLKGDFKEELYSKERAVWEERESVEQEKSSILFKGLGCISLVPFISLLHRYRNMSDTECNLSFGTTKKLDYDMHIFQSSQRVQTCMVLLVSKYLDNYSYEN